MSETMREVTTGLDLTGIAQAYPQARKVTVDVANRTAYVFIGRSNQAITITGAEFEALVKMLPPAVDPEASDAPADEAGVQPRARVKRQKES